MEKLFVTSTEDNVQLVAYLQSMITVFANANSGNIDLLQDTMQALSDAIQGRVAAEEAIQIS